MHFGEIPSPLCERHVADARLHKALHRRSVGLFTEEKTLRERLQWVEKREAQAAWREVSLMRRENRCASRGEGNKKGGTSATKGINNYQIRTVIFRTLM